MTEVETLSNEQKIKDALSSIYQEHQTLKDNLIYSQLDGLTKEIKSAKNVFLLGMGRSGFMMKAAAMRLMHLGFNTYVVGETTTPAIGPGDLLITGSGSGTTKTIVRAAQTSREVGARVVAFTANPESQLASLSHLVVQVNAAQKEEHGTSRSIQYAGSLFEQALLLIFDSVIQVLWKSKGESAEQLWTRHSNLE